MSNLKKILALVLALVMTFSVMSVSSAAFKDADAFTADYTEAVEVLSGLDVIKGYADGTFNPKGSITRAEAAAIIYRVVTGDVKDAHVAIYAGYGQFADVAANNWAAGYIGYCANAEYIKGYNATTFAPSANVTGYQMLAMLLRALGYGKNGEFVGADWAVNVARYAESLGLLENVVTSHAALNQPATRELVCELVFAAITKTPMVNYTLLKGYEPVVVYDDKNTSTPNDDQYFDWTLGYETFRLFTGTNFGKGDKMGFDRDAWGRPAEYWYTDNDNKPLNGGYKSVVAYFAQDAEVAYNAPEDECCIAADLGVTSKAAIDAIFVNGHEANVNNYFGSDHLLTAKDTKTMIGKQGRQVEFFYNGYWNGMNHYDVIVIDTFFAVVTDVTEAEYDKNNHMVDPSWLDLAVYTTSGVYTIELGAAEWDYTAGTALLINAHTISDTNLMLDPIDTCDYAAYGYDGFKKQNGASYIEIVGEAEVFTGAQTEFGNDPVHIINDQEYKDAYQFVLNVDTLDEADRYWFQDQFGNLIATLPITGTNTYGTISAIKWVENNNVLDNGFAQAVVTYMDGTQETVKVYSIDGTVLAGVEGTNSNYNAGLVSSTKNYNDSFKLNGTTYTAGDFTNVALYEFAQTSKGLALTTLHDLKAGAEAKKGTPEIGVSDVDNAKVYAGNTTQFLVWNGVSYETYTGIKNIPGFTADNTFYVGTVSNVAGKVDRVAEYVFVIGGYTPNTYALNTFFAFEPADLTIRTRLYYGTYYHTITGGYVNGEKDTIMIPAASATEPYSKNEIVCAILAACGNLMTLDLIDGAVVGCDVIFDDEYELGYLTYGIYEGAMATATLDDGVLLIGGEDYEVEETKVISYNGKTDLNYFVKYGKGFAFVVYSENLNTLTKSASYIYIVEEAPEVETVTVVNGQAVKVNAAGEVEVAKAANSTATGVTVIGYNYARSTEMVQAFALFVEYVNGKATVEVPECDVVYIESDSVLLTIGEVSFAVSYSTEATKIEALLAEAGYALADGTYLIADGAEVVAEQTFVPNTELVFTVGVKEEDAE